MNNDGSSIDCTIDGDTAIKINTLKGESLLKLNDIYLIVGEDTKRIKLNGKAGLLIGKITNEPFYVKKGEESLVIFPKDIILFLNRTVDIKELGSLKIQEYGENITEIKFPKSEPGKEFTVNLFLENWEDNLRISAPKYNEKISTINRLKIDFFVSRENSILLPQLNSNVIVSFKFVSEDPKLRSGTLYKYGDFHMAEGMSEKNILFAYQPYISQSPYNDDYHGKGDLFLYIGNMDDLVLGKGNLKITRSQSNVLKLPIQVGEEYEYDQINVKRLLEEQIASLKAKDPSAFTPQGLPEDTRRLVESLNDKDAQVRCTSARKLGEINDKRTIFPLIAALSDDDPYVRRRAAAALAEIADTRTIEPLIIILNDEDEFVRNSALKALRIITGRYLDRDPKTWQEWWENNSESFHQ
ncbi:MAG: HEAT repeat domain-containing protein [Melioribacteraceae bacterium]|nr:HEAT repeat domain-containing protein [Melioribacteraceae bacterium]